MSLTAKQQRFAQEYAVDGNATAAAIRAGFSPGSARVTACRLLKANSAVQAAVRREQAKVAARIQIDRERVINELQEAIDLARTRGDPAAMIAGWREIGRLCGFYAPDAHRFVGVDAGRSRSDLGRKLNALPDEALVALAGGGAATGN